MITVKMMQMTLETHLRDDLERKATTSYFHGLRDKKRAQLLSLIIIIPFYHPIVGIVSPRFGCCATNNQPERKMRRKWDAG